MRFDRNGWGGYELGKWNLYHSYSETDKNGEHIDGRCWCVKLNLDNKEIDFIAETMEECVEWILDKRNGG